MLGWWAIAAAAAAPDPGWLDAVVLLQQGSGTCAGVRLDPERIATAYHCVAAGGRPLVTGRGGERAVGRVSAVDRADDLAIVRVAASSGATLPLGTAPPQGSPVWALGHPDGEEPMLGLLEGTLRWSMSEGVVGAVGSRVLQVTAPVNPGNSGGPLLDEGGRVVGIVSRKLGGEGLGFAIRAELLADLLAREASGWSPVGGTVGVDLVLHGQTGEDALVAAGARVALTDRDRWVVGLTAAVPFQPRWTAARFGSASSVIAEATTGPRLRLGRGPWAVRVDGFVGGAIVERWTSDPADPLDLRSEGSLGWEVGGAVAARRVGFELAVLPGSGIQRATIALRWPGVFAVW
jgi:hypothetical protein